VLSRPPGLIEILLRTNGTLRVDAQVDGSALGRVLGAPARLQALAAAEQQQSALQGNGERA
jgi:hypothetical protein